MFRVVIAVEGKGSAQALQDALVAAGLHLNAQGDWRIASPESVAIGVPAWTLDDPPEDFVAACEKVDGVVVKRGVSKSAGNVRAMPEIKAALDKYETEKLEADDLVIEE